MSPKTIASAGQTCWQADFTESVGSARSPRTPTDSVKSACQQVCPAEAIVFGDMKDPKSGVAQLQKLPQNYRLLEYLNLQTRTSYLARIRNPNPKMPGASRVGRINVDENGEQRHDLPQADTQTTGGNA